MDCDDLVDTLLDYAHSFIGEGKKKYHQDENCCHVIILTQKGINKNVECFDEDRGVLGIGRLFGNKEVYCYDEYKGTKIGITLIYRLFKLRTVILTAFKKGVDPNWPPKKATPKKATKP